MRIAMWSGPRSLSTAMMYAFGNRPDCAVIDEPFYAAYLKSTGLNHPMRDEVLNSQSRDVDEVIASLLGPVPGARPIFYQKHMAHHMIAGINLGWLGRMRNVFLIRHPARMIASYSAARGNPSPDDLGLRRQAELFDLASELGDRPVVVDSHDIRANPAGMLERLCKAINLSFSPAMLKWPEGGRREDGVWARHWYRSLHRSTGFAGPEGPLPELPPRSRPVMEAVMPHYERMKLEAISMR